VNGSGGLQTSGVLGASGWALTVAVDTTTNGFTGGVGSSTTGSFQVCFTDGSHCITVNVTLNVTAGSSGTISANPNTLNFSAVAGSSGANPTSTLHREQHCGPGEYQHQRVAGSRRQHLHRHH
jgi:hypothetical protein